MTPTKIEWADAVWNPLVGCTVHSPGCTNCYAMKMAYRLEAMSIAHEANHGGDPGPLAHYRGLTDNTRAGPVWTGMVNLAPETTLLAPLHRKKPTSYFVNSMSDLFHASVPDEAIDLIFAVMALSPQHTYQVLTKRSDRMREYMTNPSTSQRIYDLVCDIVVNGDADVVIIAPGLNAADAPDGPQVHLGVWPLPNVWLGVSVEDQTRADQRIPDLLATPAAVRWISAEPLLGPVDLTYLDLESGTTIIDAMAGRHGVMVPLGGQNARLDWIVVGGESGKSARPMHPDWARSLRDQCAAANVPFFFKQWGEWGPAGCVEHEGIEDINRGFTKWDYGHFDWCGRFGLCALARSSSGHVDEAYGLNHSDTPDVAMWRVGKKRAGRLLDDIEHNAMPEGRS